MNKFTIKNIREAASALPPNGVILLFGVLVLGIIYQQNVYLPIKKNLNSLIKQNKEIEQKVAMIKRGLPDNDVPADLIKEYKSQDDDVTARMISDSEKTIDQISQNAKSAGLEMNMLKIGTNQILLHSGLKGRGETKSIYRLPVYLQMQGSYPDAVRFIEHLRTGIPSYVDIGQIKLTSLDNVSGKLEIIINLELNVVN